MEYAPKKYHIQTFGCQANVADSNAMAGVLETLGFESVENYEDSDVYIINTCSVRQKSEDKVYGLGKKLKRAQKRPFTIMAGCMVGSVTGERQRYEFKELKRRTPWVNEYINPSQISTIPNLLIKNNVIDEWAANKLGTNLLPSDTDEIGRGLVNISFGCDNFCRFCVVPYARGKEVSRTEEEILREVRHWVSRGAGHITLCGQNVNSWGLSTDEKFKIRSGSKQKLPFASLLRKVHEVEGVEKISFISSNPFDFTQDLIDVLKMPKIDDYLHIAVQSGNNDMLKKMNRRHTIEEFISLIKKVKKAKPAVKFGTDIIVGFPGETENQFLDSVKLFKTISFEGAFISMYSPRKGTPAEKMYEDDVSLVEKKRRHAVLTKVWKETRKP